MLRPVNALNNLPLLGKGHKIQMPVVTSGTLVCMWALIFARYQNFSRRTKHAHTLYVNAYV